jgi:glycosyltransferase
VELGTLKVSIITATYNSDKTIVDTLNSIKKQSYTNIEHIIIDGVSRDNTIELVKATNPNCIIYQEKDDGIYDAMNKGIKKATGEIIGILNSDDFYPNEYVIEKVVALFNSESCEATYGDLIYIDTEDISKIKRLWISGYYDHKNFLKGWMPPHPTFFVKKSVYERYGLFNISLWGAADYELMLRFLFKNKISVGYLPDVVVHMRTGGQSNTSFKNRVRANIEDRKAWKINGLKPKWYTLYLKPLNKISQFFIRS